MQPTGSSNLHLSTGLTAPRSARLHRYRHTRWNVATQTQTRTGWNYIELSRNIGRKSLERAAKVRPSPRPSLLVLTEEKDKVACRQANKLNAGWKFGLREHIRFQCSAMQSDGAWLDEAYSARSCRLLQWTEKFINLLSDRRYANVGRVGGEGVRSAI